MSPSTEVIRVMFGGAVVAETTSSLRVLETSHPPTYYLPRAVFAAGSLREAEGSSFCEWKGTASYLDVVGAVVESRQAAWSYPRPTPAYAALVDHVALYPGRVDLVTVDGEEVRPQPGDFYGGWVTSRVVGPFKGVPGSMLW